MLGQKEGGVLFHRRSHDATPICHFADLNNTICAVRTQNMRLVALTDVGDCPFFRAGDRIRLHTVAHIVQDPLWLARKRCGVPFAAAATTAFPSATPQILSTSCAVGTQHSRLGKSSVETCAKTAGSDKCKCLSRQSILSARPCAALFPANPSGVRVCNSERTRSGYSWRFFSELIACESAACFVHVHHCAMRRSVSSLFTSARRRFCFLFGSLMVLLGSTFFVCSLFLATKTDSARLAASHADSALVF